MSQASDDLHREREMERKKDNCRKSGVLDPSEDAVWDSAETATLAWTENGLDKVSYAHRKYMSDVWRQEQFYAVMWSINPYLCMEAFNTMLARHKGSAIGALNHLNAGDEPASASSPNPTRGPDYGRGDADLLEDDDDQQAGNTTSPGREAPVDPKARQARPSAKPKIESPAAPPDADEDHQTGDHAKPNVIASGGLPEQQDKDDAQPTSAAPAVPSIDAIIRRERREVSLLDRILVFGRPLMYATGGQAKSFARAQISQGTRQAQAGYDRVKEGIFVNLLAAGCPDTVTIGTCYPNKEDPIFDEYWARALEEARQHVQF